MSSTQELRVAIVKGQFAEVGRIASELRNKGIDIQNEINFAKNKNQISGGKYVKVLQALGVSS